MNKETKSFKKLSKAQRELEKILPHKDVPAKYADSMRLIQNQMCRILNLTRQTWAEQIEVA